MSYASDRMDASKEAKWLPAPVGPPDILPQEPGMKERGASNVPMTDFGRHQMTVRGGQLANSLNAYRQAHGKMPKVTIHSSAWDRTQESAGLIQQQLKSAGVRPDLNTVPELAPQSLGELEGEDTDKVAPTLNKYRTELHDITPPGNSKLTV